MKIILNNTEATVKINGTLCRIWEGQTESGIPVHCFIAAIGLDENSKPEIIAQFQRELKEVQLISENFYRYLKELPSQNNAEISLRKII